MSEISEKLAKQLERMTKQYGDLRAYFASGGATSDELAVLEDVQRKLQSFRQRVGTPKAGAAGQGDVQAGTPLLGKQAPGRTRTETPGYKEPSWVRPSTTVSGAPVHVGSIFFKTKESTLESREEALLRELAKAYAPYVRREMKVPGGERGLKGKVVGYADPRRSVEPNNQKLSADRATIVARLLTRFLAAESGSIEGDFDIAVTAGGVPAMADEPGPELEANSLAPLRRADIFLAGGVIAPPRAAPPEKPPEKEKPKDEPKPPPLDEVKHDWDKYDYYLNRVDAESIYAMAVQMYAALGLGASGQGGFAKTFDRVWTAIGLRIDLYHRARRSEFPSKIDRVKPSWWDGLHTPTKKRPGQTAGQSVLEDKAKRLKAWYVATLKFGDTYMEGPGKVLALALAEVHKDDPDAKKMWAYARQSEEYAYMLEATVDLAQEVMKLARE